MRFISKMFLIVLVSQVPQFLLLAQDRKARIYEVYLLSNEYTGKGMSLTVSEDGETLVMAKSSNSSKQYWKMIVLDDDKVRLTNDYLGEDKSLEVNEDGDVVMSDTGNYTGQAWTITRLDGNNLRVTNEYLGEDKSLDVNKNGEVIMKDTGNYRGQAWMLTKKTIQKNY